MDETRLAVIDIGSNSLRLTVAALTSGGGYRILDDEKIVTRLAHGLARTNRLDKEHMDATSQSIAHLCTIATSHDVDQRHAIATCAVREADNGQAFIEQVRAEAGIDVRIISAEEEGRLAFKSVRDAFDLHGLPNMVVDIGGGSTEVVLASGNVVEQIYSFPLGTVRLAERFRLHDNISNEGYKALRQFIRRQFRRTIGDDVLHPLVMFGTGGTFTNIAAIDAAARSTGNVDAKPTLLRGYELQHSTLRHMLEMMRKMSLDERKQVAGLNDDRADLIVPGLAIIDVLLRHMEVNVLRVHDQGIRNGYLQSQAESAAMRPGRDLEQPMDRLAPVRQFAQRCRSDLVYLEHVAFLAIRLFESFHPLLDSKNASWKSEQSRSILEVAAWLHDVGYYINYARYHKHSYHLIMHSELPGFDHEDIELVANVARYHRRAKPKKKHVNFKGIAPPDRSRVKRLAAILRLAVGLNRARDQRVQDIAVSLKAGVATISLIADEEPAVALWGAQRKAALFEDIFKIGLRFTWVRPEESAAGAV